MTNATLAAFACLIAFVTAISGYLIMRRSFSDKAQLRSSRGRRPAQMRFEVRSMEPTRQPVPVRSTPYGSRPPAAGALQPPSDQRSGGWPR